MNDTKPNFFLSPQEIQVNTYCTRSYLDKNILQDSLLSFSISQYGVLSPVTVMRENQELTVITGAKRVILAKLLDIKIPAYCISSISLHEIFQMILADNITQEFTFMDWAVLLRNLLHHRIEGDFLPLLQIIQNKWKYPLHFTLVPAVFNLPSDCLNAIAADYWTWQVVYYHHYFSYEEWKLIYTFFTGNTIKKNLQRIFLEELVLYKRCRGTEKLQELLGQTASPEYFRNHLFKSHDPLYGRYREEVKCLQADLNRILPGNIHLQDDPEDMSLDIRLRLNKKSQAEQLPDMADLIKRYWDLFK